MECGALFESAIKPPAEQRCRICGNPPTGKVLAGKIDGVYGRAEKPREPLAPRPSSKLHGVNQDSQEIYEATVASMNAQVEGRPSLSDRVQRTKRREKSGRRWLMFAAAWVLALCSVVAIAHIMGGGEEGGAPSTVGGDDADRRQEALEQKKLELFINESAPLCRQTMIQFFNASSAAAKAQHVYQGAKLSGAMSRYYRDSMNFTSSTAGGISIVNAELLTGFELPVIGVIFRNAQGLSWEAVFVRDGEEWLLDWPSLVRYDDRSWSLFPAGEDGEEGEFRLYMRVRDSDEDFEQKEMSLVFYKPTMFFRDEFRGLASVPVLVTIDSEIGRRIETLAQAEDGLSPDEVKQDAYGYSIGHFDPSRYHRVRVRMKVHRDGKKMRLELLRILATDWYGENLSPSRSGE